MNIKQWIEFKITGNYKCSFQYYLNHLYNYNRCSWNNKNWKVWDIFHDYEKPWLNLFFNYKLVRKIHRKFSRHHMESIWKISIPRRMIYDELSSFNKPTDAIKKLLDSNYINIDDINKYIK